MKRWISLLLSVLFLPVLAAAEEESLSMPPAFWDFCGKTVRSYESETLIYSVESFSYEGELCYLSKIWMEDPGKQIRKATASWKKNIMRPVHMADALPEAALAVNASGYVSPVYPWIPEDYPGKSEDYFYTPLGSLTVTDGEVWRNLEGVRYTGLTLEEDGLHLYMEEENSTVLAAGPTQTWAFYTQCPMQVNGRVVLPEDWTFADTKARRTVIGRADGHNYLILTVTNEKGRGLTLREVNRFFLDHFRLEWVFNLDGGPSIALLCRKKGGTGRMATVAGGTARDVDIMAFTELPGEGTE